MPTLDEELAHLRTEFDRRSRQRLDAMRRALDALAVDRGNRELLTELLTDFHAFAGLGTTYGSAVATELGITAEDRAAGVLRDGSQVSDDDLSSWRSTLDELTAHFVQRRAP